MKQIQHFRGSALSSAEVAVPCKDIFFSRCSFGAGDLEVGGLFRKTVCESSDVVDGLLAGGDRDSSLGDVDVD